MDEDGGGAKGEHEVDLGLENGEDGTPEDDVLQIVSGALPPKAIREGGRTVDPANEGYRAKVSIVFELALQFVAH